MPPVSFTSSSDGWRKLAPILLAAVVLCVIEASFAVLLPESRMVVVSEATAKAAQTQPRPDVLVLGDSVSVGSIWSSVIAEELGSGVVVANYSIPGSNPITSYFVLRRQIESGKAPSVVLYAHAAHTFAERTNIDRQVGSFNNLGETWDLYRSGFDFYELLYGVLTRWSYTLRYRNSFEALIMRGDPSFFLQDQEPVTFGKDRLEQYLSDDARFDAMNRNGLPRPPPAILSQPFYISAEKMDFILRTIELAASNEIALYWVTLPIPQATYAIRSGTGFFEDYYRQVDELVSGTAMDYLVREIQILPDTEFRDYWHLQARAGIRFSQQLTHELNMTGYGFAGSTPDCPAVAGKRIIACSRR